MVTSQELEQQRLNAQKTRENLARQRSALVKSAQSKSSLLSGGLKGRQSRVSTLGRAGEETAQERALREYESQLKSAEEQVKAQESAKESQEAYNVALNMYYAGNVTNPATVKGEVGKWLRELYKSEAQAKEVYRKQLIEAQTLPAVSGQTIVDDFVGPKLPEGWTPPVETKKTSFIENIGKGIQQVGAGIGNVIRGQDFYTPVRTNIGTDIYPSGEPKIREVPSGVNIVQTTTGVKYVSTEEFKKNYTPNIREGTIYSKQIDTVKDITGKNIPISKVYVTEGGREREATTEESKYYRQQSMRVTTPIKLKGIEGVSKKLEEKRTKLSTERARGEEKLAEEFGTGLATSVVSTGLFFKNILTQPVETIKSIPSGAIQTFSMLGNAGNILRIEPAFATGYIAGEVGQIVLGSKVKVTKPEFSVFREKPVKVYKKPEGFKGTPLSNTFPVEVNLDNFIFKTPARQQLELKKFNVEKELQRQEFLKKYPPIIKQEPVFTFEVIKPESKVVTAVKKVGGVIEKPTGKTIKTIEFFKPEEQAVKTTARQQLVSPVQVKAVKEEVKVIQIQKPRINAIQETSSLSGFWSGLKTQQSQFNALSQQQLSLQKQEQLAKQSYGQPQLQKEIQLLKYSQRQKEAQAQPLQLLKLLKQQPKQKQRQLQLLKYAQKQGQKLKQPELLKTKTKQERYLLKSEKPSAKKVVEDLFTVYGKRFGKDIKLFEVETQPEAEKKLKEFLTGTLGRSGFVEKAGKKLSFEELNLGSMFTPAKREKTRVIQKAKFSLGTSQERREIKFYKNKRRNLIL